MKFDVASYLGAVERTVTALERDGKPARAVRLSRIYKTNVEDLWDALTNEERLPRWFLPVEGDLRPGGRYLEGNAGGSIAVCDPPDTLSLTREFGSVAPASARAAARETTAFYTGGAPQDG